MMNCCVILLAAIVIAGACGGVCGNVRLINRTLLEQPRTPKWAEDDTTTPLESQESEEVFDSGCQPEAFQHSYILGGNQTQLWNNSWPAAKAGEHAFLRDMCLLPNGLPVTRFCRYNKQLHISEWEDISQWKQVHCLRETSERTVTMDLFALHQNISVGKQRGGPQERQTVTRRICEVLARPEHKPLPADIAIMSQLLTSLTNETKDVNLNNDMMQMMSMMMSSEPNVLRLSAEVNATDSLLDTFETYMDELSNEFVPQQHCHMPISNGSNKTSGTVRTIDSSGLGVYAVVAEKLSVFYVNPRCANISGIAIYAASSKSTRQLLEAPEGSFKYRFIYMNELTTELLEERDLLTATFLPLPLWQHVEANFTRSHKPPPLLVFKVYYNDNFFVDRRLQLSRKPCSKILSITIPGFKGTLPQVVPFVLRNLHNSTLVGPKIANTTGCAYWNYGSWSSEGVQTLSNESQDNSLILCGTSHLTQFGYLVGGSYRQNDLLDDVLITPVSQETLDIISLVGCSLSLLGLLGIWLTAALFPKWRANVQTKVLLNLCVALTLQMVLFLFVNTDNMAEYLVNRSDLSWTCVMIGALLQYSILVLFMWMLSIAYIQFQRYVTVIGASRPSHYVLKSALLAWGLPLIPTLISALVAPESYIPTEYQLRTDSGVCYPSGGALAFGLVLPVALIAITNLAIFVHVFYSVSKSLNQPLQRTERKVVSKQVKLYVLLFFVLGLPWIFGIFAFMGASVVFSYLFCLTATLQGFVLFVYYVMLNEISRKEWIHLFCPSRKPQHKGSKEKQSIMSTSTTVTHDRPTTTGES